MKSETVTTTHPSLHWQYPPLNAHVLDLTIEHPMGGCYGHPSAAGKGRSRSVDGLESQTRTLSPHRHTRALTHPRVAQANTLHSTKSLTRPPLLFYRRQHRNCRKSSLADSKGHGLGLTFAASVLLRQTRQLLGSIWAVNPAGSQLRT